MIFSGKELAVLKEASDSLQLMSADEKRLLIQYSAKLTLGDILSSVEEKNLTAIILKLCHPELIKNLEKSISSNTIRKLQDFSKSVESITEVDYSSEARTGLLAVAIHEKYDVRYTAHNSDSTAFFSVEKQAGAVIISFNRDHVFFDNLEKLKMNDLQTYQSVLDLLHSWGLCETENQSSRERKVLTDTREMWGRKLRNIVGVRNEF